MSQELPNKPELHNQPPPIERFNEAVESVTAHNDEFSFGKTMARALLNHVEAAKSAHELTKQGMPLEEAEATVEWLDDTVPMSEQQQMERSLIGVMNAETLDTTGLTISPVRKTGFVAGSKGVQDIGRVHFQLYDGSQFVSFLQDAVQEHPDEKFATSIATVTGDILSELSAGVLEAKPIPAITEALAYAEPIAACLETFEPTTTVGNEFRAYAQHATTGDISEWVQARNTGILTDVSEQRFGPSQWQNDATDEFLAGKWEGVIDVIRAAKANPHADALAEELISRAHENLKAAETDWSQSSVRTTHPDYGKGFDNIFATVEMKLAELEDPADE